MKRLIDTSLIIKINNIDDINKCKMVLDFYNCKPYAITDHKYPYYLIVEKYYYTDVYGISSLNKDIILLTTEEFINRY